MKEQTIKNTCCFRGLEPEALPCDEAQVKSVLEYAIQRAMREGCTFFMTGLERGFETWAAEIVLKRREQNQNIKLICCLPHKTFTRAWKKADREKFQAITSAADQVSYVDETYDWFTYSTQCRQFFHSSQTAIVFYRYRAHSKLDRFFCYAGFEPMRVWNVLNVVEKGVGAMDAYDALLEKRIYRMG